MASIAEKIAEAQAEPEHEFEIVRKVTFAQIKLVVGLQYFFRLDGPIHLGKEGTRSGPKTDKDDGQPQLPPHLIHVLDMTTGEVGIIVAPTILCAELEDGYPGEGYVGRGFAIKIIGKKQGKRYNEVDLAEVRVPAKFADVPPAIPRDAFAKAAFEDSETTLLTALLNASGPAESPEAVPATDAAESPEAVPATDAAGPEDKKARLRARKAA